MRILPQFFQRDSRNSDLAPKVTGVMALLTFASFKQADSAGTYSPPPSVAFGNCRSLHDGFGVL